MIAGLSTYCIRLAYSRNFNRGQGGQVETIEGLLRSALTGKNKEARFNVKFHKLVN